jgi:hypothetical protein
VGPVPGLRRDRPTDDAGCPSKRLRHRFPVPQRRADYSQYAELRRMPRKTGKSHLVVALPLRGLSREALPASAAPEGSNPPPVYHD